MLIKTDRSRVLARQRCPRKRYWGYEYESKGLTPANLSMELVIGSAVHIGLEHLLKGDGEDDAAELAKAQVQLSRPQNVNYDVWTEAEDMAEGLVRIYARYRLPDFLKQFEVLEVEQEDETIIYDENMNGEQVTINFMSRADGLLRERKTDNLYVLSFKTTSGWDGRKSQEGRVDMQGLSETFAAEKRLAETIMGVQMEYLVKGYRRKDASGEYHFDNAFLRPWQSIAGGLRLSPQRSKDWERFPWRAAGFPTMGAYFSHVDAVLGEGQILADHIIVPMPYFRQADDMRNFEQQLISHELTAAQAAEAVEAVRTGKDNSIDFATALNIHYEQHRGSCNYPGQCEFKDICFGEAADDPLGTGQFVYRLPNHPSEGKIDEGSGPSGAGI